jgi:hypothetical protein
MDLPASQDTRIVVIGLSILVAEGSLGAAKGDQAPAGHGDLEGIAGDVIEHRLLALPPGLAMNDTASPTRPVRRTPARISEMAHLRGDRLIVPRGGRMGVAAGSNDAGMAQQLLNDTSIKSAHQSWVA